jgi:tetratricopeptide (TPR) repeat protein
MYNILISFALAALVGSGLYWGYWKGASGYAGYATLVASVVFVAAFFVLSRLFVKKLTAIMAEAEHELQANRTDKAIKVLEKGLQYRHWQLYVTSQIHSQIGMIYYIKRDFAQAFEHLKKGISRNWAAMGMLAICYMKRSKPKEMKKTFEKAVALTKNEPLLWNLYAFCMDKIGEHQQAIEIMERGLKKTSRDEKLEANLSALREGRRMKMENYGPLWYQFHLEKTGELFKMQVRSMQGRRKMVRR